MKEERVNFKSGELELEGLVGKPASGGPFRAAVVCHPHPLYGGSMYNNVVDAVLEALWERGFATLRFNFRGVGASEGDHDNGRGETDDAIAAMRFLIGQADVRPDGAVMAGYSFGAMVAVRAGARMPEAGIVVAIALPVGMADTSALESASKPVVMIAGDRDSYCPDDQITALAERLGARATLDIIAGADHFFGGYEEDLTRILAARLGSLRAYAAVIARRSSRQGEDAG